MLSMYHNLSADSITITLEYKDNYFHPFYKQYFLPYITVVKPVSATVHVFSENEILYLRNSFSNKMETSFQKPPPVKNNFKFIHFFDGHVQWMWIIDRPL